MSTNTPNTTATSLPDWLSQYLEQTGEPMTSEANLAGNALHALFARLTNLNSEEITYRANEIKRLLRNSGFIETGEKRRWRLDPLPLLVSPDEWQTLSAGVEQRVRLLNQVLNDLNGPKNLLTSGVIPAALLMRHPYYLQECHGSLATHSQVFLVAMDIGRDQDGQYYLLNDHCQFPRGLGLLLENRIVARRVMSEEFAECGVQRIAGFFQQLQQAINQATSRLRDPRVVILSRGPQDPYYSEQAYLATYLGYTLVRSADLTVRKGKVWLKALDGLRKVDVILRWIEDRYLDSLEQIDYSEYGIPGLLQAVREESVILLNPFGNGLIQIPALRNNLARAASALSGENLILNELPTMQALALNQADWPQYELLSYLDPDIKLDGEQEQNAISTLLKNSPPEDLFWRRKITLTQAPFWQRGQLVPKPVIVRCYALHFDNQVHMLPSALCLTPAQGKFSTSTAIKDTWVQSVGPHLPSAPPQTKTLRKSTDLALMEGLIPSRTAENLFWLGCSLERSEDLVRLLRLFIDRFTELAIYPDNRHRSSLIRIKAGLTHQTLIYPYQPFTDGLKDEVDEGYKMLAQQLMKGNDMPGGLHGSLSMIMQSALQVRELLSYDSLRIIENMETELRRLEKITRMTPTHSLQSSLDKIVGLIMAFNGSILDSLSNSNGSFMLEIGRRLERSNQLVAMLQTMLRDALPEAEQQSMLEAVLVAQVSSVTHRRRYRMYQSVETGLELLLLDAEYPRSLAYQIEQLAALGKRLPSNKKPGFLSGTDKILLQLRATCAMADHDTLTSIDGDTRHALLNLLDSVSLHLKSYSEVLQTQYFSHTRTATKLNWSVSTQDVPIMTAKTEPEGDETPSSTDAAALIEAAARSGSGEQKA